LNREILTMIPFSQTALRQEMIRDVKDILVKAQGMGYDIKWMWREKQ